MKTSFEQRLSKIESYYEIKNMMGDYERLHTSGQHQLNVDRYWSKKRSDVSTDIARVGLWVGQEGIQRFWVNCQNPVWDQLGHMHLHTLTTPVIEVAEDGETAKGIWMSPGVETSPEGKPLWAWVKYGIDFVFEDGSWKFWHFHLHRYFMTPYDEHWIDVPNAMAVSPQWPADKAPDYPSMDHWVYTKNAIAPNLPRVPSAYSTWLDSNADASP